MYVFRDTTALGVEDSFEALVEDAVLPSEALSINGEFIEKMITGYKTLRVSGREALSPELDSYETGVRDGATLLSKRYPPRKITVEYQLIARSNEEFREAYNTLARILDVKDAELIFNDELDKYYTGTPSKIREVEPGSNAVIGEFEVTCFDPFKYSIEEYVAEPVLDDATQTFVIDYNGTYKSFPVLEAEIPDADEGQSNLTDFGDCGYIAFFNEREKIVQLGDPDEDDSETYKKSQTLVKKNFTQTNHWGTAAKNLWQENVGKVTNPDNITQTGSFAIKAAFYNTETPKDTSGTLLSNTLGSGAVKAYHSIKYKVDGGTREKNKVTVSVTITSWLANSKLEMGKGYILVGSLWINEGWKNITLKSSSAVWKGTTQHSITKTYTISGLTAAQTAVEGIKFKVTRTDTKDDEEDPVDNSSGELSEQECAALKISAYINPTAGGYYLAPSDFGSGENYHGPSITRTIPADNAGEVGASNFTFSYKQKMCIGNAKDDIKQRGAFQVLLTDANNTTIAGVNVYKGSDGKRAKLRFYVNGKVKKTLDIDLSFGNMNFGASKTTISKNGVKQVRATHKTSTIVKSGSKVTFKVGGKTYSFSDSGVKEKKVEKITFTITKRGSKPALEYNGLYWAKFVKNNCDTWRDVPNKFSAGDIVTADCRTGEILLNDNRAPELGALGNDWEEFYLQPGTNQIGISHSDWVRAGYEPSARVRYREVFL